MHFLSLAEAQPVVCCWAVDHLMASLEARTAEAGLYRRQYDALSSRLDHVEKAHRDSRAASRQHAEHEVNNNIIQITPASAMCMCSYSMELKMIRTRLLLGRRVTACALAGEPPGGDCTTGS